MERKDSKAIGKFLPESSGEQSGESGCPHTEHSRDERTAEKQTILWIETTPVIVKAGETRRTSKAASH